MAWKETRNQRLEYECKENETSKEIQKLITRTVSENDATYTRRDDVIMVKLATSAWCKGKKPPHTRDHPNRGLKQEHCDTKADHNKWIRSLGKSQHFAGLWKPINLRYVVHSNSTQAV